MRSWLAHAPAEKMQEVPNQVRNIIPAFAEGRDFDWKNIKSKEQIVSELSSLRREGQVLVRCGDDPDVHRDELITCHGDILAMHSRTSQANRHRL